MQRVEVHGLSIAYERAGSGPPLVLLHGYVGDAAATWRHQIDELSKEFTVVAWDAPGAGRSEDPPEDFGITGYADCLAGFIAVLGLQQVHIVGLSFGGALALRFQNRHRELVRTLVLASGYAGWRGSLPAEAAEARLAQALHLSGKSGRELVETLLPTMFALPVDPLDFEAFRAAVESFHPSGFRSMAMASAEDLRDLLPAVDIPTLVVCGNRDPRAPIAVAEDLHRSIRNSRLVVLEGAGHGCNDERGARLPVAARKAGLGTQLHGPKRAERDRRDVADSGGADRLRSRVVPAGGSRPRGVPDVRKRDC